jgi:GTP pyrophosphokinase
MVKVADNHFVDFSHREDPQLWLSRLPLKYNERQQKLIAQCFDLARHRIEQNAAYEDEFKQGLAIADVLVQLHVDATTLATALIYPFFQSNLISSEELKQKLSSDVAKLCEGVKGMDAIQSVQQRQRSESSDGQQLDNFRRMLLAMVDDVRLVLIKLAERLSVLRQAKNADNETRVIIAEEVRDIYAPLANRLGVGQLKWEMEDLAFRYLQPAQYKTIAKKLDERRVDRERYVKRLIAIIEQELNKAGIQNAEVMGRAKHIYSIWRKMQRKNVGFEEIYDVRAVRILVDEIPQCYAALGIVHGLWKHIPKEFDDYIATPKENGYRSLHTAVIGPEGKTIEVQIRTKAMHQESELGVAAHWRYKEGTKVQQAGFEAKISWLRHLLEWQEELADSNQLIDNFRSEVIEDRIYVFTPQGKVIDLPVGATPVDFAYAVHTDVGHACRGAKVGGRIVPLTYQLKTGEQVEILTSKNGQPSRDWLNPHNGYIRSSRARAKIHQWFRHQDKDKNAAAGKTMFDKDIHRHGLENFDLDALIKKFNFHHPDEFYAAIGAGDIGMTQVLNSIRAMQGDHVSKKEKQVFQSQQQRKKQNTEGIQIEGVGSLLTRIAGCCRPVPGDAIKGYITQGRGVVVHRQDCNYIVKAMEKMPERLLDVSWGDNGNDIYDVDVRIIAFDRKGLLKDITTIFANEKISVESLNSAIDKTKQKSTIRIRMNVENIDKLSRIMAQLEQIPNVLEVKRMG